MFVECSYYRYNTTITYLAGQVRLRSRAKLVAELRGRRMLRLQIGIVGSGTQLQSRQIVFQFGQRMHQAGALALTGTQRLLDLSQLGDDGLSLDHVVTASVVRQFLFHATVSNQKTIVKISYYINDTCMIRCYHYSNDTCCSTQQFRLHIIEE